MIGVGGILGPDFRQDDVEAVRGARLVGEVDVHCPGREDGLRAVLDAEFAEDRRHMTLHRAFRNAEVEGDLLVQAAG